MDADIKNNDGMLYVLIRKKRGKVQTNLLSKPFVEKQKRKIVCVHVCECIYTHIHLY